VTSWRKIRIAPLSMKYISIFIDLFILLLLLVLVTHANGKEESHSALKRKKLSPFRPRQLYLRNSFSGLAVWSLKSVSFMVSLKGNGAAKFMRSDSRGSRLKSVNSRQSWGCTAEKSDCHCTFLIIKMRMR
jgi:hypothetical protein